SVAVNLPMGPNSALAPNGRLCGTRLLAPTTLVAQSGAKLTPNTKVAVTDCPLLLLSHKLRRGHLKLRLWAPKAGRVSVILPGAKTIHKRVGREGDLTITAPVPAGTSARPHGRHRTMMHISFAPASGKFHSTVKLALG
ncbi:MAG TPA: hypothetical protein VMB91_12925, partial [Solirubrobacteraceae bacterium]|nr:hypothetical protein [Solirubrobacteraceae bacterium]